MNITDTKKDWDHIRTITDNNVKIPSRSRAILYNEESPLEKMIESCLQLQKYPVDIIDGFIEEGLLATQNLEIIQDGDLDIISTKTDFLGVNYYSRAILRADCESNKDYPVEVIPGEKTKFGWEVFPEGLERLLIEIITAKIHF